MAELRCPNCGKDNPASLTFCQYCQALLTPETPMRIGDKPTKKTTGELEPVLPDWLRDVRQQARDSAEKDAAEAASMPKVQKEEPTDLLAGLASQSGNADDEDIPDWLASLSSRPAQKPAPSAPPASPDSKLLAKFDKPSAEPQKDQPQETPSSTGGVPGPSEASMEHDELSEWLTKASGESAESFTLDSDSSDANPDWSFREEVSPLSTHGSAPQPPEEEDLSWLRDLEAESKKTGDLAKSKPGDEWSFDFGKPEQAGPSGQEDLSWLDHLGAIPPTEGPKQESSEQGQDLSWLKELPAASPAPPPAGTPSGSQEDLSWLDALGGLPSGEVSARDTQPEEDLSWLKAFSDTPVSLSQEAPPTSQASQDDLSWLDELGKTSLPPGLGREQPPSEDDLSWLRDLKESPGTFSAALASSTLEQSQPEKPEEPQELPPIPQLSPRRTAPLDESAAPEIPDWLKSATEESSLPLGPQALDQMREDKKIPGAPDEAFSRALFGGAIHKANEPPAPSQPETPPAEPELPSPAGEAAVLFNEGVNPLFSEDLPEWLTSTQPEIGQPAEEIGIHAEGGETLSPADLPAWVQAMRPVEAVIAAEAGPGLMDQPIEREGPLAGLRGVIPMAAIGSLRRPHPIPLTLQATEEQQASAAILEQILLGETTPRPLVSTPVLISQRRLRWLISGLILFVLGAVLFSGTQIMPVSPVLPREAANVTNTVTNIADNAPVLVILDYEPALAGEMEAASGPVLDQLVQLHRPYLSFIATSSSGNALVERLLANTNINQPDGAGYISGQNYTNMGYLPGGESGVLAFLQSPQVAVPSSPVLEFSEYAAIFLLTDQAESARIWVEQLYSMKQADPMLASQPLIAISSAQSGPMLQPYFYSGQINGMVSGLPVAVRYELLNNNRPGTARSYWDAFGVGMMMAVFLIVFGSAWSLYTGIRARRAEAAEE